MNGRASNEVRKRNPAALKFPFSQTAATLLLLIISGSGCHRNSNDSRGVELLTSSATPNPAMTFELRFDRPMVKAGEIGLPAPDSPLVLKPTRAGTFTWLSPRSGVFTPAEPLALDAKYVLTLRPGLREADGQPSKGRLHWTITTPPFSVLASWPVQSSTNAGCEPEVKLVFNANVRAAEAARYLEFRDAGGQTIHAEARQGTLEESPGRYSYSGQTLRTWLEDFDAARPALANNDQREVSGTNEVANLLLVSPEKRLPLGRDWRLNVKEGMPATEKRLRLRETTEVHIGDITPFLVTKISAHHHINSGASVRIDFSKEVSQDLTNHIATWITVAPQPSNPGFKVYGRQLIVTGDFLGETDYTLTLNPNLHAAERFTLAGSNCFVVRMPRVPSRLYFPACSRDQLSGGNRVFPLLAVNVPRIQVRAKLLEPHTAIHALRGYRHYFLPWERRRDATEEGEEPYRSVNYDLIPGRTIFNEEIEMTAEKDVSKTIDLSWDRLLTGRTNGIVFLEARRLGDSESAKPLGAQALIQLTDLGLVWKTSRDAVEVFVFSHSSGQPISGASARLYSEENEVLVERLTDTNGRARLATITNAQWVAVERGDDFHALPINEDQVGMYSFHLPLRDSSEAEDAWRVMLFSDRNLYRPGEELHLQTIVREWSSQGLSIPPGLTGNFKVLDPHQRALFQTNAHFDASGAWSAHVPLLTTARGGFTAQLRLGTNDYSYWFQVQDFQPNAFELTLRPKPVFEAGEKIEVPVSAHYLFGKKLSNAQLKWYLEACDSGFQPEGFANFNFKRAGNEWRYGRGPSSVSLNGQGTLAGSNDFLLAAEVPVNPASPQPRAISLLVEVTDVNQQTLSQRAEFIRHSSDFYLGLRPGAEVFIAGETLRLEVAAVASNGKPWRQPVRARLTLKRIDWESVRVQGAGKTIRYRNEAVFTNVFEQELEVQPIQLPEKQVEDEIQGNRLADLPALPAGEYLLEATAKDSGGRPVLSSVNFTVSAPAAQKGWNYQNDTQLTLKPNQKIYAPGQTAEILVQTPFSGTALVTVEREKVLRSFVKRLEGNAPLVAIPLEPGDVPNVFVSVTLVRGADECPRQNKEPEYRLGFCDLTVADPQTELSVTVTPGMTDYLPGQSVEVAVQVTDLNGTPTPGAGLVLYAVDDGILGLSDYQPPDPHKFFYATRPLGVQSSISLPNLLAEDADELSFENKGYLGGGGGMEALRKNFVACALWNASLISDAEGKAAARFPAPDSLTRYRIFAVATSGATRFGSAKSEFRVSKPLLLEPALPRFASITDRLLARGVVQNQTTNAGEVIVSLELDEKAVASAADRVRTQHVTIPANGSAIVEFPVDLAQAGRAKWIWKARFCDPAAGSFIDAVQSELEVGHLAPVLREILLTRVAGPETNLLQHANPQLLAGEGTMTITIANTRLNELAEAAAQLLHYPYGCAEQTGSSLLPWILLRDSTSLLPLLRRETNEMDFAIRAGVARLFSMQTSSGGLGYWPGAREPMLWASAYGGMVLALAKKHGADVPKEEFEALLGYLRKQLRSAANEKTELADGCFGLYALALAGRGEHGYHEKFYLLREKLSDEDRALLALAIAESRGSETMIDDLLKANSTSRLRNEARFDCDARARAIRLLAWIRHRPTDRLVDQLVDDLMREQKQAHWGTTQGNAWALLALTDYAQIVEGKLQPVEGELQWRGESIPFRVDEKSSPFTRTFVVTNSPDAALKLFNHSNNRLYTSLALEARPIETPQPRQDRGFGLERRYDRLDDNNQPRDLTGLQVGDRVLVTLRLNVREPARYLVIDDALPCILEAINPEFKTQEARPAPPAGGGDWWPSDFREIRQDRCLSFASQVAPGSYALRYVARVRAAGTVTAPSAKVEEMYHPERCGLSGSEIISSVALRSP